MNRQCQHLDWTCRGDLGVPLGHYVSEYFYRVPYLMLKYLNVDYELHLPNLSNCQPAKIDA